MLKMKYLWLAALVALCAVLSVGSAYAQGDHWVVAVEAELDDDGEPVLDEDDNPVMVEIKDFPSAMVWEWKALAETRTAGVSFGALNDGSTTWSLDYDFRSVEGTTETALSQVDRWGLTFTPADGITPPVEPDETYNCAFSISAPPITTLAYVLPVGPTTPPGWMSYIADPLIVDDEDVSAFLECDWTLANLGALVTDSGLAESEIALTRYPDDAPDSIGGWAGVFIEECAGRVPFIVQGYPDGLYRPRAELTRDAMAVFMRRAMKIPQVFPDPALWVPDEDDPLVGEWTTYNTFPDVPYNDGSDPTDVHWAVGDIEALVAAEVVAGYPDLLYHPEFSISRAQMAVFVARAADYTLQRDEDDVSTLEHDPFPDVTTDFWAAPEIWACARNGVVVGYPDGYYRPTVTVNRAQMAVYSYRAFMQSTACAVVLAGPAVGNIDPSIMSWTGVSTVASDPAVAWVGFDGMRLGPELAFGGGWTIKFEYYEGTGMTLAGTVIAEVTPAQIATAKADAQSTGVPYFYVSTAVPGLPSGAYTLRVSVEDVDGTMFELVRTVELSSSVMPPPPGCPRVPDADSATEWMAAAADWGDGNRVVAGASMLSAMAENDETYYVSSLTAYPMGSDEDCCDSFGESFVWHDVEDTATALRIELDYHVVAQELVDPFSCCLGVNPCIDWNTTAPFQPEMGWGLGVMKISDPYEMTDTWGSESDLYKDTDYTDVLLPDFEFVKMALDTDETVIWETSNVSDYRSAEGDVVIHFCGGAYQSLYVDKLVLTTALPPLPRVPDADDPEPWMTATTELPDDPDGWGDASRMPRAGASLAQMAATDMVYYYADLTLYAVNDDSTYCCVGYGETFVWNNIPTDALDLTVKVRYHIETGTDFTCCGDNPCDAWGGEDPLPGSTEPPYGWGLGMMTLADPWEITDAWGGDMDIQAADSPSGEFRGHPTTDQTYNWTSTDVANYVNPTGGGVGDVVIHWCGNSGQFLAIDELTLVFTPGPASPPVWPVCP